MKEIEIYNLEFPPFVKELHVSNYVFSRIDDYALAFGGMMHLVNSTGSEYSTQIQTGSHQITAKVLIPETEQKCSLPFGNSSFTQIEDILFLLSIFTGRNVFKKDWVDNETAITSDHRQHQYGGQLVCSVVYESMWQNKETGELKNEKEMKDVSVFNYNLVDVGFEKTINTVLTLISSEKWQEEYEGGYFLFLFKSAIQRQIIETSFISCWTIWEHVFAIKNRKWLDDKAIEQLSGDKKIAFILNEYFLKNVDDLARENIKKINKTRNRIVHFGKKTDNIDYKEMELFIRLTEQMISIILGLSPSNIFNSFERLDAFLKTSKKCQP